MNCERRTPGLWRLFTFCLALTTCVACASAPVQKEQWAPVASDDAPQTTSAQAPPPAEAPAVLPTTTGEKFDSKAFAAQYPQPNDCLVAAKAIQARSKENGWLALKGCVAKGNFILLREIATDTWMNDLTTRPDAAALIMKVIAARGGSVESDLRILHERRVPVFGLAAAMAQPGVYNGRLIVLRAKVSEIRSDGGNHTVMLDEYGLGSEGKDVQVGSAYQSTSSRRSSGQLEARTTKYGNASVRGSGGSDSSSSYFKTERQYENVSEETGRVALGRLKKPDPFLVPEKEFIVLARFDGVRETPGSGSAEEGEEKEMMAVLSVLSYQLPNPLVVY